MASTTKQFDIEDNLIGAGVLIAIFGYPAYVLISILLEGSTSGAAGLFVLAFSVSIIWRERPQ